VQAGGGAPASGAASPGGGREREGALDAYTHRYLARAAGVERVRPGDEVWAEVHLAYMHDSTGPRRIAEPLRELGDRLADAGRVHLFTDHFVPASTPDTAALVRDALAWGREHGVHVHDMEGISHQVVLEEGLARPGQVVVGADSHSLTGGAVGAVAIGVGSSDLIGAVRLGKIWLEVPEAVEIRWEGRPPEGVTAKDMMLATLARVPAAEVENTCCEWAGEAVYGLELSERAVLANMGAELGVVSSLVPADRLVCEHLGVDPAPFADAPPPAPDAYARRWRWTADDLEPFVALPHSPRNGCPVAEAAGTPITHAYIGSCVGARLSDLHQAARVLRGRRVAPGVTLLVAPASRRVLAAAAADGTLTALLEAGATLLPTACGPCAGLGGGVLPPGAVCVSTTNRNFRGRMGSPEAAVYLGSSYTTAWSAVRGALADPREALAHA
jgi:3-isopropylmalate/(R)-2-methylmalate dehydratase large subunit